MAKKKAQDPAPGSTSESEASGENVSNVPAVKADNAVAEAGSMGSAADWGNGGVTSNDIIIPRILLMQPMSQKVTAGEAAFTEFRESLSNDLIGNHEKPFEIVPFMMEKVWVEFNVEDPNDKKFLRVVPITPQNELAKYEYEEVIEGKKVKCMRDRTLNFYVLLPHEIESGAALPYIISMRRSSMQAGKKLATQMFVKNTASGKTPAATVMAVSCSKTTNDKKQTYAVADVKPLRATPDKYVVEAFKWLQIVKSGKAKAHEESYNEDVETEVGGSAAQASSSAQPQAAGPSRF